MRGMIGAIAIHCALLWCVLPCAPVQADAYRPLRVVTYNIALGLAIRLPMALSTWHGPGLAYSLRANQALQDADIVALQEVCITAGRQLDYLHAAMQRAAGTARIWQAHATDGGFLDDHCSNAQVTLSRFPIIASGRFEFPMLSWRNAALWTDHDIGDWPAYWNQTGRLRVYNLHLINRVGRDTSVPAARWVQMQALLKHYNAFKRNEPDTPVLLVGDFNAIHDLLHPWRPERTIQELSARMYPSLQGFHPTHVLLQQTDWIFSDAMRALTSRVVVLPWSDHFAVVADY